MYNIFTLHTIYTYTYIHNIYIYSYLHVYIYLFIYIFIFTYAYIYWTGVSLFLIAVGYDTSHCPIQKIHRGHWYWVMVQSWGITVYCNLLQLDCRYTFQSDDAATSRLHQQVSVDSRLARVCDCAILLLEVSPSSPPKKGQARWFYGFVQDCYPTYPHIHGLGNK